MAVTVWVKKDLVSRIDNLAEKGGLSRSKLIANLLEVGVEEIEVADKVGFWALARVYQDLRERLKKKIGNGIKDERAKIK